MDEPVPQELLYSAVGAVNAISRVSATGNMSKKSHGFIFENIIFYTPNLAGGSLYLDKPVLQEILYSAVGAVNTDSHVAATGNVSEKSYGFSFENVIFHTSNLHASSYIWTNRYCRSSSIQPRGHLIQLTDTSGNFIFRTLKTTIIFNTT